MKKTLVVLSLLAAAACSFGNLQNSCSANVLQPQTEKVYYKGFDGEYIRVDTYDIIHNGYNIRYGHIGGNDLVVYFFKPSGTESYVIRFYSDHFVVIAVDDHADRNEIGVVQYYYNNPGTEKVKNAAVARNMLRF